MVSNSKRIQIIPPLIESSHKKPTEKWLNCVIQTFDNDKTILIHSYQHSTDINHIISTCWRGTKTQIIKNRFNSKLFSSIKSCGYIRYASRIEFHETHSIWDPFFMNKVYRIFGCCLVLRFMQILWEYFFRWNKALCQIIVLDSMAKLSIESTLNSKNTNQNSKTT